MGLFWKKKSSAEVLTEDEQLYLKANEADARGDYAEAVRIRLPLAQKGMAKA